MKQDEKWSWQLVWASIGLMAANCLLVLFAPGTFGLDGILYYGVMLILCVIDLVMVYLLVRKFFGNKK